MDSSNKAITRGQYMTLVAAFLGWMFDGFELGLLPLVARPALTELLAESVQTKGSSFIDLWEGVWTAGFLVGMSTGGVLFGWLGDRIGRVRAMTFSIAAYSIFSALCGFAGSAESFFAYRFIAALGMGGEWSLGVALVMEIWPASKRGLLSAVIGAAANVGFLLVAMFALVLHQFIGSTESLMRNIGIPNDWIEMLIANQGWRLLMILGGVPAVLTFFVRLAVPESEKWQAEHAKGKTSFWLTRDLIGVLVGAMGALFIVYLWAFDHPLATRIAGSALGLGIALVGYLYPVLRYLQRAHASIPLGGDVSADEEPIGRTLRNLIIAAILSGVALIGTWASTQRAPSWSNDLARDAAIAEGVSAEVVDSRRIAARANTQMVIGLGAIVGTIAGAFLGVSIGRRKTYALLCITSLGASALFFQTNHSISPWFFASGFLLGVTTASFYGWLPLYLPELFPTRVRATAQGFSFNFGRILAAVAALQTGALIGLFKESGGLPTACTVMSLVYGVGFLFVWLAPETGDGTT